MLHGRQLRPGTLISSTAQFDDALWSLAPATVQAHQRGLTLNFGTVPKQYEYALKSLIYVALSGPIPVSEERMALQSVASLFYDAKAFLTWLDEECGYTKLSSIGAGVFHAYQQHLLALHREPSRRHTLRTAVAFFWRYRAGLDKRDAFSLDPRNLDDWHERRGNRGENKTARIPETVQTPLLVWAMRFVDDFADDIIEAIGIWVKLRNPQAQDNHPRGSSRERVRTFLMDCENQGRAVPGREGKATYLAIARLMGCDPDTVRTHSDLVESAARSLGVSAYSYLDVPVKGQLDGQPWTKGISVQTDSFSLVAVTRALQAACYIVIAFLSGMRDSEIKHIRTGSCLTERDRTGRPYRWRVSSLAFKGEQSENGVPATWVVGRSGANAIAVLERAHRAIPFADNDLIFAAVPVGPGIGSASRTGNSTLTSAATNSQLNHFISWVNNYCLARGRSDAIPDVDGSPWRLSTRQFRRTLAWYVARRPGGSIAGAIAYRHHSVQMFEGYAGTADSGFRAEVEAEQAMAEGEQLLALIDEHEHEELSGPAADDAQRRLKSMGSQQLFVGTVTSDRHRFKRLLKLHGPNIHPGKYVTCVYTASRALCRPPGDSSDTPDQTSCKPLACRNVALTRSNRETWAAELEQINRDLTGPPLLPPAIGDLLRERRIAVQTLLARHEPAP